MNIKDEHYLSKMINCTEESFDQQLFEELKMEELEIENNIAFDENIQSIYNNKNNNIKNLPK